ncbi:hypothetical protein EYC80_008111 [Monilinia laxa]|uniref:Uncharacterized protein n=1 Tax=Monilinia laxa TaxID=61186 RepID=A0A5N6JVK9_MONLA|nr:hypothetical protein EYC80_008111 [Monilinia laxa]
MHTHIQTHTHTITPGQKTKRRNRLSMNTQSSLLNLLIANHFPTIGNEKYPRRPIMMYKRPRYMLPSGVIHPSMTFAIKPNLENSYL